MPQLIRGYVKYQVRTLNPIREEESGMRSILAALNAIRRLLVIGLVLISVTSNALAQKRVAFVVGNSAYPGAAFLRNPINDAQLMAGVFKDNLGFDVVIRTNLSRRDFYELAQEIRRIGRGADAVVVYYSGHGLQGPGGNYLLPVDAHVRGIDDVRGEGLPISELVDAIEATDARAGVLILDSCRDYPAGLKGGVKGLRRPDQTGSVLVAFATQEGATASEGTGSVSPYARALAEYLRRADLPLLVALDYVSVAVKRETGNAQRPTRYGDMPVLTCLVDGCVPPVMTAAKPQSTTAGQPANSDTRSQRVNESAVSVLSAASKPTPPPSEGRDVRLHVAPIVVTLANIWTRKDEFVASFRLRSEENSDLGVSLMANDQGGRACANFKLTDGRGGVCPACWSGNLTGNTAIASLKLWRQGGQDPFANVPPMGVVQHVIYFPKARCLSPMQDGGSLALDGEFLIRRADGSAARAPVSFIDIAPARE